jgi:hypothetical protein
LESSCGFWGCQADYFLQGFISGGEGFAGKRVDVFEQFRNGPDFFCLGGFL